MHKCDFDFDIWRDKNDLETDPEKGYVSYLFSYSLFKIFKYYTRIKLECKNK